MSARYLSVIGLLFLAILAVNSASAAPTSGNISVAFIMAGFEDQDFQEEYDQDYFEDTAFANTNSMWDYFDEVSKGALNIEGNVYGPYTLDGDAADYSSGSSFVRDSVEIADDDIYYPDYDAVVAIHSGPGGESSGNSNDIWSAHWPTLTISTDDEDENGNDHFVDGISQVPEYQLSNGEKNPLGVWCHEFGHELGLPDYYDTDGSSEGVGNWAVMAAGSWGNNGETPVYFSAYSRYWLGWDEPILVQGDIANLVIEPVSEGGKIYKLPIPGNWTDSEQYFLLENRQQTKYDTYLPGEGLLIWHIDEEVMFSKWSSNTVNNDEDHKGMDLEEADGDDDLDSGANRGDSGDPYRSGSFTKDTYPNSLAYNGSESGWKIDNIEVDGDNIVVDISFLSKPHAIADADEAVVAEGEALQFYGNESWDEDGQIVNYTWNFGDGKYNYTDNPVHIFTENGEYNVTLTVRDNNGLEDTYILNIFVNKPPVASISISKTVIMLGESITFDASNSYDLDGEIDFYYWNFDDGRTSNQIMKEHTYSDSGIFNVSLKLIDNLNDISTTYYTIEVINSLPEISFDVNPNDGNTLTLFEFIDSSTDADGEIEEWLWLFGDGNTSNEVSPSHYYSFPGNYNVTLTLTDDQNGVNSSTIIIFVNNSPPNPDIVIEEGIISGENQWIIPTNREVRIDGGVSLDNDNTVLTYQWQYDSATYYGQHLDLLFVEGEHNIELTVSDPRGANTTETFILTGTNLPILNLNYEEINLVVNQDAEIITSTFGEVNLYEWKIYQVSSSNLILLSDEVNVNLSKTIKFNERGDYKLIASARDSESNLWTNDIELDVTVYDKPTSYFEFDSDINEDTWIGFNGSKSTGLGLNYVWKLDGNILDSNNAIISTFIDSGGYHVMNLTVEQEPVGIAYYESEIYLNSKPTGVLQTSPTTPRVGEDFEIYLNAFDVETDANIEYLKIKIIDNKDNERAEFEYINQGANFNLIFEVEYAGEIILEYSLIDESGNKNESINSVNVIGWADIFISDIKISGSKEKGAKHQIETILTNYNETYNSTNYNGYTATGYYELFIDSELVHTSSFSIEPESSESFKFEWTATGNYHEFNVKAYVNDGEINKENNEYTKEQVFESERKSGFLPSLSLLSCIVVMCIIVSFNRSKPN